MIISYLFSNLSLSFKGKVIAFKGSNEVTVDYDQDFDPDFYLDYKERNYVDLTFVLQKLHLSKEQRRLLFDEFRKLKKHIEDEMEADEREYEEKKRYYEAKLAQYE